MKRYKDATAIRRALETRLKQETDNTGGDLGRLRRRVVFDRLAVRLSVDDGTQWILKGGAALEFRLGGRARATKDLDVAVASGVADGLAVRELRRRRLGHLAEDIHEYRELVQVRQGARLWGADLSGEEVHSPLRRLGGFGDCALEFL